MPTVQPVTLTGRFVQLEPLSLHHAAGLALAAGEDRSSFGWTRVPDGRTDAELYVREVMDMPSEGSALAFAQRRTADGAVVGSTRLFDLRWWRGRTRPDEAEVGGTWLTPSAQLTPINTEAKLLLLTHAFEHWQVVRVAICTDERNERSRAAITRLGARFEGVLRNHRASYVPGEEGQPRNTAVFSVVESEWGTVKAGLLARLGS